MGYTLMPYTRCLDIVSIEKGFPLPVQYLAFDFQIKMKYFFSKANKINLRNDSPVISTP